MPRQKATITIGLEIVSDLLVYSAPIKYSHSLEADEE